MGSFAGVHTIVGPYGNNYLNQITPSSGNILPNTVKVDDKDCISSTATADAFNEHFISCVIEITSNVPLSEPVVSGFHYAQ